MDNESSQNIQTTKFKSIPHVNVTDLIPLEDIIIVKSQLNQQTRKKRKTSRQKFNKDDKNYSESTSTVELTDTLNQEFPQCLLTPREFGEKHSNILSYMEDLNKLSTNIEMEKSKNNVSKLQKLNLEKINKLKISALLNRTLHRNLRIPTINEFISVATHMNMKEAESYNGNFTINVDSDDNSWSELNLFNYFKDRVKLDTYQLVSGGIKFSTPLIPPNFHSHLLTTGPKCKLDPLMFHKKATENYFKENNDTNAEIVDDNQPIITISFYHNVRGHKYREYDILSCQTLAHLTDSFSCSSEIISEDFDLGVRGSCYMINGVLYPDLRNGACDYSENLLEFYRNDKTDVLKSYTPIRQDTAVLHNIELKLNQSGYFLHHGDCEHRVTVTNVRIFDKTRDCPYVKCYPLCTFIPNQKKLDCQICEVKEPTKTVFNSLILPENPSYLCEDCYTAVKKIKLGSDVYFDKGLTPSIAIEYNQD